MTLSAGTRLGAYEIVASLGVGGQGEVYEARDTRLDRRVAIKVLPSHLANDVTLRARFEREARAVSALNHPHICTLYDVGNEAGTDFLVMEYLEGQTLSDRLKKGPFPLGEALRLGAQIADALDCAHREGVVHRDLKPGNTMLTKSGAKLLDFGLAKQRHAALDLGPDSELATEGRPLTEEGAILGTVQYMAPEQLEGKEADSRTDVFALGAVLYEMVTGRRAFRGGSTASIITAIMGGEPQPLAELQPVSPPLLQHLVNRCLAKDPSKRWQSAGDLKLELEWLATSRETQDEIPVRRPAFALGSALAGAVVAGALVWAVTGTLTAPEPEPRKQFTIPLPANDELPFYRGRLALSPDGTRLVYAGRRGGVEQLFLRSLESGSVDPIPGTQGGAAPFFSPDGEWIGFFANDTLKKVAIAGGAPVTLDEDVPFWNGGGAWGSDDTIVYGADLKGLRRISASRGNAEPLTRAAPGERHWEPEFLPDDAGILYSIGKGTREGGDYRVAVMSLDSGESRELLRGHAPRFFPRGHLVFARDASLWAAPFDPQSLEVTGDAELVVESVWDANEGASYDVAADGSLVYEPFSLDWRLVWVDRFGRASPLPAEPARYISPRLSPDGKRLAVNEFMPLKTDGPIWIVDLERGSRTLLTLEKTGAVPIWTPDGREVTFAAWDGTYSGPVDGSAPPQQVLETAVIPGSWSPDGLRLAYHQYGSRENRDIFIYSRGEDEPRPFATSLFQERNPAFSPDGRWLAYVSDETGRDEVYVQAYPGPGGKVTVSTEGGFQPVWSPAGGELFYRDGHKMMVVQVETGTEFRFSKPELLFEERLSTGFPHNPNYTVSPDGQRFVMVQEDAPPHFEILLDWASALDERR